MSHDPADAERIVGDPPVDVAAGSGSEQQECTGGLVRSERSRDQQRALIREAAQVVPMLGAQGVPAGDVIGVPVGDCVDQLVSSG
nr:hypothetical protein [Modestobacter marinus]